VRKGLIALAAPVLSMTVFAAQPAGAQDGPWHHFTQPRATNVAQRVRDSEPVQPQPNGGGGVRSLDGLPPRWVERLRDMPPEQQERFLDNNRQFQNLPPQRQQQIRQNLEKWNNLTPEQKQALRDREKVLESLSPEQRQYIRNTLLPQWQAMPIERRQVIKRHLAMLSQMSPTTQEAMLNDPKFLRGLSPDEQVMLRSLNSLRNPPPQ
jgi:Protein of unknown function (DUF3106)